MFATYDECFAYEQVGAPEGVLNQDGIDGSEELWHPFPSRVDFDFADFVRRHRLNAKTTDELMTKIAGTWAQGSFITMASAAEVDKYVAASVPDRTKVGTLSWNSRQVHAETWRSAVVSRGGYQYLLPITGRTDD